MWCLNMPLSIISVILASTCSFVIVIGSMVCFCMSFQPSFPRVMPVPQYSQVMTISPNLGEMGAPQLGHFSAVAPAGAITGPLLCCVVEPPCGGADVCDRLVPHL